MNEWGPNITVKERLRKIADMTERECRRVVARAREDGTQPEVVRAAMERARKIEGERMGNIQHSTFNIQHSPNREVQDIAMATLLSLTPPERARCAAGLLFSVAGDSCSAAVQQTAGDLCVEVEGLATYIENFLPGSRAGSTPGERAAHAVTPPPKNAPPATSAGTLKRNK